MRTGTGPSAAAIPPSPALVISAVRAPSRAARNAAITPAGPPPMTTTSRLSRLEEAIPASIRAVLMLLPRPLPAGRVGGTVEGTGRDQIQLRQGRSLALAAAITTPASKTPR